MKYILALVLAVLCSPVAAFEYKSCIPGLNNFETATRGTNIASGWPKRHGEGWTVAWVCKRPDGVFIKQSLACVHGTCWEAGFLNAMKAIDAATNRTAALNAATAGMTPCSIATGPLKILCDRASADGQRLFDEWWAANAPPPPPTEVWKVAPNGVYGTRPVYRVVSGARDKAAVPGVRATVGDVCDLSTKVGEGTSTYAAHEPSKATVTLCRKVP